MADEVSAWVATLAAPGATAARLPEGLRAESIDFLRRLARASVRRDAAERGLLPPPVQHECNRARLTRGHRRQSA